VKEELKNVCSRYGLSLGRCILFLLEFYRSVKHDPRVAPLIYAKLDKAYRRARRRYREILATTPGS